MTYTYAILEVSQAAYEEIRKLLTAAGYDHAFHHTHDDGQVFDVIDMHGIGLKAGVQADGDRRASLRAAFTAGFASCVVMEGLPPFYLRSGAVEEIADRWLETPDGQRARAER
jgi:hypothetical protein